MNHDSRPQLLKEGSFGFEDGIEGLWALRGLYCADSCMDVTDLKYSFVNLTVVPGDGWLVNAREGSSDRGSPGLPLLGPAVVR